MRRASVLGLFCSVAAVVVVTVGALPAGASPPRATPVPQMRWLDGVACLPGGSCVAVGASHFAGGVVVLKPGGPVGAVRSVPGTSELLGVACPTASSCVAVGRGSDGAVVVRLKADGTPGAVQAVPGATLLFAVACPTPATCLAVGEVRKAISQFPFTETRPVFVVINNGRPSPAQPVPGKGSLRGIACPTTTTCLATYGRIVVLSKGHAGWTATAKPLAPGTDQPTAAISCPSSAICYATASGFVHRGSGLVGVPAMVPVTPEGVTGPVQILSGRPGESDGIACTAVGTCTVVGADDSTGGMSAGLVIQVRGGHPAAVTDWAGSTLFAGVSCVRAAVCAAVGGIAVSSASVAWPA